MINDNRHPRLVRGSQATRQKIPAFAGMTLALSLFVGQAYAQAVPVNYDRMSYFEEPNSWELPGGTLSTNLTLDQTYWYDEQKSKPNHQTEIIGRARFEGQLENTMRLGVDYVGHFFRRGQRRYENQVQAYIADDWGTVAVGHVSLAVREDMRRRRGIGHAELLADDFYSGLDQDAIYYRYNHRAYTVSMVADRQGGAEIGVSYARPIGDSAYRYALRLRRGDTTDRDLTDGVPTPIELGRAPAKGYGAAVVAEYTYGSWNVGWQGGYEYLDLKRSPDDANRFFNSAGLHYKTGAVSMSLEGLYGDYDGDQEVSAALGVNVDISRGLSVDFGYNWSDYMQLRTSQGFMTLCYSL